MKSSFVKNCAVVMLVSGAAAIWAASAQATTLTFDDLTYICGAASSRTCSTISQT